MAAHPRPTYPAWAEREEGPLGAPYRVDVVGQVNSLAPGSGH